MSTRARMPRLRRLSTLAVAITTFGAGLVGLAGLAATPAYAAGTTTVVTAGSIAPNGSWSLEPTSNTGTYSFVNGPATPPVGTGSLAMGIASGQHEWLNNYAYGRCALSPACNSAASMTPIANIDALSYSTYRTSGTTYPTLNVEVWSTGTGAYATFVFVPNSASVVNNTWQSWDGLNPSDGTWYSTQALATGPFTCGNQSCPASWSQIQTGYPNAKVAYGLGPNVGSGGTFAGNVDNLAVGVSGNTTIFDFERGPECTTTCFVNGATGNDANTGLAANPLKTIQAGVNKVASGGTVNVAAGTYTENVTIAKALTLAGAGQANTTIIPAVSDPNCGGAGGGSLCAGASNVILVQSGNVTIHDLSINGDNPALTSGIDAGGADLDARNGIITNSNAGVYQLLSVHDVTVKNVYLRGIYASSGGSFNFTNNTVDNVQADPASIAMFDWIGAGTMSGNHVSNASDAISANHSSGTSFTNNVITGSGSGVHTDNAGDGGGSPDVISGNTVSACQASGYGIWDYVPYIAPTITSNTVSGCAVGLAAFASCAIDGAVACPGSVIPSTTFSANTVTGIAGSAGLYVSTDSFGAGDGDVHVSADHNTFSGHDDGIYVQETGAAHATVSATRNALTANTNSAVNNTGVTTVAATCNWYGHASGPGTGQIVGPVTAAPWLISSNLNSNCTPVVKIGNAAISVAEGNSGNTPVTLPVTLDRPSSQTVTVFFNTQNGTAAVGDYHGTFGTVTFAPGETAKTITVNVIGDTVVEPNETFNVKLSSPTNAILANANESVIIKNDDKPTMTVANVSVVEGNAATFTVTLADPYYQAITVSVATANGTAHAPGDYTVVAGATFVIPAGSTSHTFSVTTKKDTTTELAETFTAKFTSASIANSPKTATATIAANHT